MNKNTKRLITLVALSIPFLGQAGRSDPYGKMLQIQNAMWKDMKATPRMSNTYGRKLESNLSQLRTELRKAAGTGRSGRGSARDSDASDGNVELLITVAMAASDADLLDKLSRENQEELGSILDTTVDDLDEDFVDQANELMDTLDSDLGVDSTRGYRYHRSRRYDNPAARRVAAKRRHVTNHQSRKSARKATKSGRKKTKLSRSAQQDLDKGLLYKKSLKASSRSGSSVGSSGGSSGASSAATSTGTDKLDFSSDLFA